MAAQASLCSVADAGVMRFWATDGELTPPSRVVSTGSGSVVVRARPKTDFWQRTGYGFVHDNGHFCPMAQIPSCPGAAWASFELTVAFAAEYAHQFDQAGLMLRASSAHWLKAGIEYVDGRRQASVVVTRGARSDWSVVPVTGPVGDPFWVRLRGAEDGSVSVAWSQAAPPRGAAAPPRSSFTLMRLADFLEPPADGAPPVAVMAGIATCAPTAPHGFAVEFGHVSLLSPAPDQALHEDQAGSSDADPAVSGGGVDADDADDDDDDVDAGVATAGTSSGSATTSSASSSAASAAAAAATAAAASSAAAAGGAPSTDFDSEEYIAKQASSQVSIMAKRGDIGADLEAASVPAGTAPPAGHAAADESSDVSVAEALMSLSLGGSGRGAGAGAGAGKSPHA
ncbi:hypothetical protein FNF27_04253 [Cafeteria roenbergensis]|uniref:Uncharacterized protein n=1 Tax=Cafeteria roenbergensis TaxID=33653 RepID=A0A5A8EEG0_CAFRO|nr:hypothetical protein FNF27_04253 [Cafeteria roenbergensis]